MALFQTPADVKSLSTNFADFEYIQAASTVVQGQPVRLSGNKYQPASSATAVDAMVTHIALTCSSTGGYFWGQKSGAIHLGATLVDAETYYVDSVAGKIQDEDDVGTGEFPTILGQSASTSAFQIRFSAGLSAKP